MVGSVMPVSSASIIALLRISASVLSPSKGRYPVSVPEAVRPAGTPRPEVDPVRAQLAAYVQEPSLDPAPVGDGEPRDKPLQQEPAGLCGLAQLAEAVRVHIVYSPPQACARFSGAPIG